MKVVYHNRKPLAEADEAEYGAASYAVSLETLLRQSDVVSVHCPLNAHTTGLIGKREFAQMKDGVFFVNTARGAVVDESALIHALESGKVARAGLDVFDGEPKIKSVPPLPSMLLIFRGPGYQLPLESSEGTSETCRDRERQMTV